MQKEWGNLKESIEEIEEDCDYVIIGDKEKKDESD